MIIFILLSLTHLTLPYNGKLLLSGTAASSNTEKPENLFWNPAGMGGNAYLASAFNYSGVLFGSFGKTWKFNSTNLGLGVQLMSSETLTKTSPTGTPIGTFNYQSAIPLIAGNFEIKKFIIGAKILFPYTTVDEYKSYGLGADLGVIYSLNDIITFSTYLRNFGNEIEPFISEKEEFPVDIRLGGLLEKDKSAFSLEYSSLLGICSFFSYDLNKILGFTIGYNSKIAKFNGIETSALKGFTFGVNIKYKKMTISAGILMSGPEGLAETISICFIP
ncbi:MAG: hypothetical protein P8Y62_05550 [candidate division WOR-3 bacterium]